MAESEPVQLWASIFLCESEGCLATCSVDQHTWSALMNRHEGCRRLFARIEHEEKVIHLALGSYTECARSDSDVKRLIMPQWALDLLGSPGMGDLGTVRWLTEEAFPPATRVVLRPHDSAFYHSDAKDELEQALTRIGVLQKGSTILVSIQALGDYQISFDVIDLEPANIVLAEGEEVVMEFEAALDAPPEPEPRPDTPIPECDFSTMISAPPDPPTPVGRSLGGTNRYTADGKPWNPYK